MQAPAYRRADAVVTEPLSAAEGAVREASRHPPGDTRPWVRVDLELRSRVRLKVQNTQALAEREVRVKELEEDRDALLEGMSKTVPGALNRLTGEERNKLYRMLRLEVTPSDEGYEVSGAFCASKLTPGSVPSGYATSSGVRFAAAQDKIRVLSENPPEPNDKEVCGRMREWEDEARYMRRS